MLVTTSTMAAFNNPLVLWGQWLVACLQWPKRRWVRKQQFRWATWCENSQPTTPGSYWPSSRLPIPAGTNMASHKQTWSNFLPLCPPSWHGQDGGHTGSAFHQLPVVGEFGRLYEIWPLRMVLCLRKSSPALSFQEFSISELLVGSVLFHFEIVMLLK